MKINLYTPHIQHDLKSAARFIDNHTNLSAKLNNRNQIELKAENGVTVRRLDGNTVAQKMNQNSISTYV